MSCFMSPKTVFSKRIKDLTFEVKQKVKSPCPTEPLSYGSPRPVSSRSMVSSFDIFRDEYFENFSKVSSAKASNAKGSKWALKVQNIPVEDQESAAQESSVKKPENQNVPLSARSANSSQSERMQESSYFFEHELRDSVESLPDPKLGKPTRASILRARQRCHSAPINAYEKRREHQKKFREGTDFHHSLMNSVANEMNELVTNNVPTGESVHSYLTGARYNRQDYLDAKTLNETGFYVPRNDPKKFFVVNGFAPKVVPSETPADDETADNSTENKENSENSESLEITKPVSNEVKREVRKVREGPKTARPDISTNKANSCERPKTARPDHSANLPNSVPNKPNKKDTRKERRVQSGGFRGSKLSAGQKTQPRSGPSNSANNPNGPTDTQTVPNDGSNGPGIPKCLTDRPKTGAQRSPASNPPTSSLFVKGKTCVLGWTVPKKATLKNSKLRPPCPPTSTPTSRSVTALDVSLKMSAEFTKLTGCCVRCGGLLDTLIDSSKAFDDLDPDTIHLNPECKRCGYSNSADDGIDHMNAKIDLLDLNSDENSTITHSINDPSCPESSDCPPNTLYDTSVSNSYKPDQYHEFGSRSNDIEEVEYLSDAADTRKSARESYKHHVSHANRHVSNLEKQFSDIPEADSARRDFLPYKHFVQIKEFSPHQAGMNSVRREKKVPLFILDVKLKKGKKKRNAE